MKDYRGVIFDFNGTLFFDHEKHILAWNRISREIRGRDITREELFGKFNGVPNAMTVRLMFDGDCTDETAEKYSALKESYYRQYCLEDQPGFHLVKGAAEFFDRLKGKGIPMTIASASIWDNIDFFIRSFGLDQWVRPEDIVYDDGTYEDKVAMYRKASEIIGVPLSECLIIEDSLSGIRCAYEAGCRNIIVVNSAGDDGAYASMPGVTGVISDFTGLMDRRMNMNERINQLISYALKNGMITEEERDYSVNLLLDLFGLDSFEKVNVPEESVYTILDGMLDYAVKNGLCEDNTTAKDLFDTRIMNCIMPRPSEVIRRFNELYEDSPERATDYFYHLSVNSNYIRKSRTDKNIKFNHFCKYAEMQITINLSKPEKDPKEIAAAKLIKSSGYPKCLLCKENVGFAGHMNHPARQTHRIIPLDLEGRQYYMQYSPYVYYNEHCIIFNRDHIPMTVTRKTFENLLAFITKFPHYMLGSNADLPIVGGSILTHDHYQGGRHHFPMEDAETLGEFVIDGFEDVKVEMLKWPLSAIRLTASDKKQVVDLSDLILNKWIGWSDEKCGIIAYTGDTRHNTITPIARMKDGQYQMDLVLRNNRTSEEYPLGIFHPHQEHHHIKKENIGLIEVMGLAVLPARLKTELEDLKECLLDRQVFEENEALIKHKDWYDYLRTLEYDESTIDELIEKEVTRKFTMVLENAGVYKMDENGIAGFVRFIEALNGN